MADIKTVQLIVIQSRRKRDLTKSPHFVHIHKRKTRQTARKGAFVSFLVGKRRLERPTPTSRT